MPLLVEAWNACYGPHFPDEPELTVERFKRETRELNLWASSCMVAIDAGEPIGVLLSAKRDVGSLIRGVAIRPGHEGQGHGRHLLDSLRRKLAILGPPRITAEVPGDLPGPRAFFEACGYRPEARYASFVLENTAPSSADPGGLSVPVTVPELDQAGCLDSPARRAWSRSATTLRNLRSELEGRAVISEDRVEAWVLHRTRDGTLEVPGLGHAGEEGSRALLGLLLQHLRRAGNLPIRLPRLSEEEIPVSVLESWGFQRVGEHVGLALTATPD